MVEVGVVSLKKTVHAKESQVAFFRIKNLEDYIAQHIEHQISLDNTWSHATFEDELWIKIGVSIVLLFYLPNNLRVNVSVHRPRSNVYWT